MSQFSDCCYAEGNLLLLSDLSWPIQAHAITRALIPHCNVPDPPTDEEDTTISQTIRESSPMNMNIHTYSVEA